jgi:hypothetical protein
MRVLIEAIVPNDGEDFMSKRLAIFDREMKAVLTGPIKDILQTAFKKRVARWKSKPGFPARYSLIANSVGSILVYPSGTQVDKWKWTSAGTAPHAIVANKAKVLKFQKNYNPHTRPGNVYGGPGKKSGKWVNTPSVMHPGTAARDFEQNIVIDEQDKIMILLHEVIARVMS